MSRVTTVCLILSVVVVLGYTQGVVTSPQASRGTTPCMMGYYWTTQSCAPCQQVSAGYCTCSSYGGCDKQICNPGYALNGTQCVQCPSGCSNCGLNQKGDAVVCLSCTGSYNFLVGGVCLNYPSCAQVDQGQCQNCNGSNYFNYNFQGTFSNGYSVSSYYKQSYQFCSSCTTGSGCQTCGANNICLQCSPGYFWQVGNNGAVGECQQCSSGCITCTNSTSCQTCTSGFYLNGQACTPCSSINAQCTQCQSGQTCQACNVANYLNSTAPAASQCTACPQPNICTSCSNSNTCTACTGGYFLQNGICYQIPNGCQENQATLVAGTSGLPGAAGSNATVTCNACVDTFFRWNATSANAFTCTPCANNNNAPTGTTTTNWVRCAGPYDQPAMTPLQATQCANTYFLAPVNTSLNVCVQQSQNNGCLTLSNITNTDCQTCLPGFAQYTTNNCQSCFPMCTNCIKGTNNVQTCEACQTGYYLNTAASTTNSACVQCSTGNNMQNCISCSNATTCTQCATGSYLNNTKCTACQTTGCVQCANNVCSQCQNGFSLVPTPSNSSIMMCLKCPAGCSACDQTGQACTSCNYGFILQGQSCISLQQDNCMTYQGSSCTVCNYGFYMFTGGRCLQCVDPYSGYVCRENPTQAGTEEGGSTEGGATAGNSTNATNGTNTTNGTTPNGTTPTKSALIYMISFIQLFILAAISNY